MAIVVGGVVGDLHMGEADEADDKETEQSSKAELEGAGSRRCDSKRFGRRGHRFVLSPSTRGPLAYTTSLAGLLACGSRRLPRLPGWFQWLLGRS